MEYVHLPLAQKRHGTYNQIATTNKGVLSLHKAIKTRKFCVFTRESWRLIWNAISIAILNEGSTRGKTI